MVQMQGIRIKNYRALKDVSLGKFWNQKDSKALTPMTVVIGKNGVGKSTLFDAFGFLGDCLKFGVEEACDARGRGGFEKIRLHESKEPIEFEIYYKENGNARPITYELSISLDDKYNRPYVFKERLRQRRRGQKRGRPFSFLILNNGSGVVWKGSAIGKEINENEFEDNFSGFVKNILDDDSEESKEVESVELQDQRRLGIAALGSLKQHPRISAFRQFIESWYLSYFTPDAARSLPLAGPQKHLNIHGDNLGNVVQFIKQQYPKRFKTILDKIAEKIPGIDKIDTERTSDGRLLIRFNDKGFQNPFYAQQMSDGTLKIFAYLLLLEDPSPPRFLCIEEPENGIYHKSLEVLANEFRSHANKSQVFITTHQPYFVDALSPEEVWILDKGHNGFSTIKRASSIPIIKNMASDEDGLPLGGLWYSDYMDAR